MPGRSRLLKISVKEEESKMQILRNAKLLKSSLHYKYVFVGPDRTPREQTEYRDLLRELKEKREKGEDVVLYTEAKR